MLIQMCHMHARVREIHEMSAYTQPRVRCHDKQAYLVMAVVVTLLRIPTVVSNPQADVHVTIWPCHLDRELDSSKCASATHCHSRGVSVCILLFLLGFPIDETHFHADEMVTVHCLRVA
jgi:hypothetical protein